jgi:hypothetical protein
MVKPVATVQIAGQESARFSSSTSFPVLAQTQASLKRLKRDA